MELTCWFGGKAHLYQIQDKFRINAAPRTRSNPYLSRIMLPQDVHYPIYRTLNSVMLHGRRNFADIIKVQTLMKETSLDYPGGPNLITWAFISRQLSPTGSRREMVQKGKLKRLEIWELNLVCWLCRWIKGAMSQVMCVASRSWGWHRSWSAANKEMGISFLWVHRTEFFQQSEWACKWIHLQNFQKGTQPCPHLDFGSVKSVTENQLSYVYLNFQAIWLWDDKWVLFYSTKYMIICYGSSRKQIQTTLT